VNASSGVTDILDICLDSSTLQETYCDGNSKALINFTCPIGYTCNAGRCILDAVNINRCLDSDGGKEYYTYGFVTVYINSSSTPTGITDKCLDSSTLQETYCDGNSNAAIDFMCKNGCLGGACIKDISLPVISGAQARPDSYSETGETDDDTEIYFTWKITGNATKCYAEINDETPDEDAGTDGQDTDTGVEGLNIYYVQCCNVLGCSPVISDSIQISDKNLEPPIKIEIDAPRTETAAPVVSKPVPEVSVEDEEGIIKTEMSQGNIDSVLENINENILMKEEVDRIASIVREEDISEEQIKSEVEEIGKEIYDPASVEDSLEDTKERYKEAVKNIEMTKTANFQEIKDPITNKPGNVTVVTLSVKPKKTLFNLSIYEEIPKSIASNADEIIFYDSNHKIIEPDPLILWSFPVISSETEISYGIKKKIDAEELETTKTIPLAEVADTGADYNLGECYSAFRLAFPILITGFMILVLLSVSKLKTPKK
jgi:hypothetical protein